MAETGIGARVRRLEDNRLLTGLGRYTDDISRPGQVYAFFLRSPHAHARIGPVDKSAALASPGVIGVFTGNDLAADGVPLAVGAGLVFEAGGALGVGAGCAFVGLLVTADLCIAPLELLDLLPLLLGQLALADRALGCLGW